MNEAIVFGIALGGLIGAGIWIGMHCPDRWGDFFKRDKWK